MRTSTSITSVIEGSKLLRPLIWLTVLVCLLLPLYAGEQERDSFVKVTVKHKVPIVLQGDQLVTHSAVIEVLEFPGVVLDARDYIASYIGSHWSKLESDKAKFSVEFAGGESVEASLIGVDERISIAVLQAQGVGKYASVLGSSFEQESICLSSWDRSGHWGTSYAQVLNVEGSSSLPDVQVRARFSRDTSPEFARDGSSIWDGEGRFLGFVTSVRQAGFNKNLREYGVIPVKVIKDSVATVARTGGNLRAGWLGIWMDPEVKTVRIDGVERGAPAERAGLRRGDYVLKVNEMPVRSKLDFMKAIRWTGPQGRVQLSVASDDEIKDITVELAEYPIEETPVYAMALELPRVWRTTEKGVSARDIRLYPVVLPRALDLGISVDSITPQLARFLKSPSDHGLLVKEVVEGSLAQKYGFRAGDILVELNGIPLVSSGELKKALGPSQDGMYVVRFVREGAVLSKKVVPQ